MIEILIVRGRGDARLRAEVPALRHQLGVLERQVGGLVGSLVIAYC